MILPEVPDITMYHDRMLVFPEPENEETAGGIVVLNTKKVRASPFSTGIVMKMGPGRFDPHNRAWERVGEVAEGRAVLIPLNCKVTDRVVYATVAGQQIILNGIMWHVFGDCDVLLNLGKDVVVSTFVSVRELAG